MKRSEGKASEETERKEKKRFLGSKKTEKRENEREIYIRKT
jgi:hypothetical protein